MSSAAETGFMIDPGSKGEVNAREPSASVPTPSTLFGSTDG